MLALNELQELAQQAGFDACGATAACPLPDDSAFVAKWVRTGHHGTMDYLARNAPLREDIRQLVPGATTVIVCLLSYYKTERQPAGAPHIAMCGLSKNDYHEVVKHRLSLLEQLLKTRVGDNGFNNERQHLFCDSAPVFERRWAQRAGLGWIGRNKLLIHPTLGSFVHIGILVMNAPIEDYSEPTADQCGECQACLMACPTGALRCEMFDARRCVSYLTIERKEPLEEQWLPAVKDVLYGCDCCQTACPHNQGLQPAGHEELVANPAFLTMTKADWESTSRRQKQRLLHRLAK